MKKKRRFFSFLDISRHFKHSTASACEQTNTNWQYWNHWFLYIVISSWCLLTMNYH